MANSCREVSVECSLRYSKTSQPTGCMCPQVSTWDHNQIHESTKSYKLVIWQPTPSTAQLYANYHEQLPKKQNQQYFLSIKYHISIPSLEDWYKNIYSHTSNFTGHSVIQPHSSIISTRNFKTISKFFLKSAWRQKNIRAMTISWIIQMILCTSEVLI